MPVMLGEKYVRIDIGDEVEPIVQALRMSLEEAEGAAGARAEIAGVR